MPQILRQVIEEIRVYLLLGKADGIIYNLSLVLMTFTLENRNLP